MCSQEVQSQETRSEHGAFRGMTQDNEFVRSMHEEWEKGIPGKKSISRWLK